MPDLASVGRCGLSYKSYKSCKKTSLIFTTDLHLLTSLTRRVLSYKSCKSSKKTPNLRKIFASSCKTCKTCKIRPHLVRLVRLACFLVNLVRLRKISIISGLGMQYYRNRLIHMDELKF